MTEARCGFCGETYPQAHPVHNCRKCRAEGFDPDCEVGFTYYPDGEYAYWAHTRDSIRHQAILDIHSLSQAELLNRMSTEWTAIRADAKRWQSEDASRLRRLFRRAVN